MQTPAPCDFDVLIVGGGLVGTALALALSRHPSLRIGLIDSHSIGTPDRSPPHRVSHYDDRSVALAHGTRLILEHLGIWSAIEHGCQPIDTIHISERGRFGATRLNAGREGVPALGYVIENRVLGQILLAALTRRDTVQLLGGREVAALTQNSLGATVTLRYGADRQVLRTKLLVAADGAHSALRAMAGIGTRRHDYRQAAIIANVSASNGHCNTAYERFTDGGPLALLPLRAERCALVMTVDDRQSQAVLALDDTAFIRLLQRRFGHRMGRFERVGKRSGFPLASIAASSGNAGRVLLIGNACHNLHPVAGQGFNLAMRDIGALAELLLGERCRQDPGTHDLLAAFEGRRRDDHRALERFTDALVRIFGVPFKPLGLARGAGLIALDLLPPLRHALARRGMGLHARLPQFDRHYRQSE